MRWGLRWVYSFFNFKKRESRIHPLLCLYLRQAHSIKRQRAHSPCIGSWLGMSAFETSDRRLWVGLRPSPVRASKDNQIQ
jgi:hypothetical protein